VGVELLVAGNDFLVARVGKAAFDTHGNGLGHFVRNDLAEAFFAVATGRRCGWPARRMLRLNQTYKK